LQFNGGSELLSFSTDCTHQACHGCVTASFSVAHPCARLHTSARLNMRHRNVANSTFSNSLNSRCSSTRDPIARVIEIDDRIVLALEKMVDDRFGKWMGFDSTHFSPNWMTPPGISRAIASVSLSPKHFFISASMTVKTFGMTFRGR
jgi:hypothetical protein